jgi:DNA-binding transcriptional regulator YhcF (GntR family)
VTKTLQIRIQLDSQTPVYRQIVDAIRVLLVDGSLAPGSKLPSVRRLAMELGVHFNTVGQAYRQLAEEGWLDLHHGRAALVLDRGVPGAVRADRLKEFRARLQRLVAQMRAEGVPPERIEAELLSLTEVLRS